MAAPEAEPTLPPEFAIAITPTNTPLSVTPSATPTGTMTPTPEPPTPDALQATQTAQVLENATPTSTLEAPPLAPQVSAPFCPDTRAVISSPGNGATVSGVFSLIGTATHEQFNFYKVEFAPGADAQQGFTYLADGRGQVFDGALASGNTCLLNTSRCV